MEVKFFNLLSTLFRNKDFISQESPILAVEDINFFGVDPLDFHRYPLTGGLVFIFWKSLQNTCKSARY